MNISMNSFGLPSAIFAALLFFSNTASAATAVEHLKAVKPPVFKKNHTLLPLSRWGWYLPFEATVELTENWGYALEFGAYATSSAAEKASDNTTRQGKVCALTRSDPERYPLFVITDRPLGEMEKAGELPESIWLHDKDGKRLEGPAWKRKNPEAPDEVHKRVAEKTVAQLLVIKKNCPISIILHGGESGLTELGHSGSYLRKDPSVVKAKGDRSWWDYLSEQKARWIMPTTQAIREAFPDRKAFIWYHFGGMPGWSAQEWTWNYDSMRPVADIPGQSLYYKHFNTGWTGSNIKGEKDLLTHFLASVAQAKLYGDALSYNWLSAGWKEGEFSDLDRYMGFVKSLYMAGQVGGIAGYFSFPENGFSGDVGEDPPHWLQQIMVLGRAHALFSHLEEFIRQGELLAGPDQNVLVKNRTGKDLPAYEFPTGDSDVRVLARKLNKKDEWIVSAWAADGDARDVTVFIDEVGELTLNARPAGSIYRVVATVETPHEPPIVRIELIDVDPMYPSTGFGHPVN